MARGAMGGSGLAVVDRGTGALVLRGEPEAVEAALEVLAQLDVPLASYQVSSTLTTLRDLDARGISAEGWLELGELRVGRLPFPAEGLRVRVRSALGEDSRRFEGVVSVLDGHTAEIWTGTTYPERNQTFHERAGQLRVYETTTLVPVRTGFRVCPRGREDGSIELEIAPAIEERVADGVIVRTAAATRVRVRPGEGVVVASTREVAHDLTIDPFGLLDHREGASDSALIVSVELVP